mmetsp:Transcript_6689/g.27287  ORF Transcript_6689/g.27287 Transcript_6689/m.27287 type:complete len:247 (+) Transcript_6689:346-1086(+)
MGELLQHAQAVFLLLGALELRTLRLELLLVGVGLLHLLNHALLLGQLRLLALAQPILLLLEVQHVEQILHLFAPHALLLGLATEHALDFLIFGLGLRAALIGLTRATLHFVGVRLDAPVLLIHPRLLQRLEVLLLLQEAGDVRLRLVLLVGLALLLGVVLGLDAAHDRIDGGTLAPILHFRLLLHSLLCLDLALEHAPRIVLALPALLLLERLHLERLAALKLHELLARLVIRLLALGEHVLLLNL